MTTANALEAFKAAHDAFGAARREVVALSAKAQHAAKQAIFAVQRDDAAAAKVALREAEDAFEAIGVRVAANARLAHEGSYRAALEEYAEARFVAQIAGKGEIAPLEGLDEETQIAGLCDAVGETVRLMVRAATEGRDPEVRELGVRLRRVMDGLHAMDYSGYLRTKYDQARGHERKAEDVLYDLSLRR